MRILLAAALVLAIGALVVKLAAAPLYARYDAEECRRAYSRSGTLADTARVDLHPYAATSGPKNRRCGEVRARNASSQADIPAIRQPNEEL
jgi:hypothetical protein